MPRSGRGRRARATQARCRWGCVDVRSHDGLWRECPRGCRRQARHGGLRPACAFRAWQRYSTMQVHATMWIVARPAAPRCGWRAWQCGGRIFLRLTAPSAGSPARRPWPERCMPFTGETHSDMYSGGYRPENGDGGFFVHVLKRKICRSITIAIPLARSVAT